MRIGDVYEGPRGGRREVEAWEWHPRQEENLRAKGAPCPEGWRGALVLAGPWRLRQYIGWADLDRFATATRITEGTGDPPPWESV